DAPVLTPHEDFYQLSIPMDTEVAAECFVYQDALDSAATLQALLNELLAGFPETGILKIDAGTFGQLPYVYQESLYLTEQGAAGVIKGIVVPVGMSTLACLHDEPGYRETFMQVVDSLAGSLHFREAAPEDWGFQEILVWRLRDLNIGYTVNSIGKTEDGEIKSVIETAVVIPRTATETLTHDGYDVVYELGTGELIAGSYAEATSGELTLSISLEQAPEGGYRVAGKFQGKDIDSPLDPATSPVGPYRQLVELVKAANPDDGQPRALSIDTYVPSASPLQTLAVEAKPTGQRIGGLPEYALLFAGMEATSVVDAYGQQAVSLQMGPMELQLNRVYLNGQI
ncbi:MAG TPA: hypothetical protein VET88_12355, partial [Gammaproteobacteria bacterium]|nr:hypothetical protein [Gammaproteobacteria bacterium]